MPHPPQPETWLGYRNSWSYGHEEGEGMSTVWVVESGEYSDYRVHAIFTQKETAERYAAKLNSYDVGVNEWPLDAPEDEWGGWSVWIDRHGKVVAEPEWQEWTKWNTPARQGGPRSLGFIGYGKTAEHARRSAEQLRRETLATYGSV